jgi:hypothetical protein
MQTEGLTEGTTESILIKPSDTDASNDNLGMFAAASRAFARFSCVTFTDWCGPQLLLSSPMTTVMVPLSPCSAMAVLILLG